MRLGDIYKVRPSRGSPDEPLHQPFALAALAIAERIERRRRNGGYEVQIWRLQPAGYNTGAIVGTAKTARDYTFKADQWNHYQITADGDSLP